MSESECETEGCKGSSFGVFPLCQRCLRRRHPSILSKRMWSYPKGYHTLVDTLKLYKNEFHLKSPVRVDGCNTIITIFHCVCRSSFFLTIRELFFEGKKCPECISSTIRVSEDVEIILDSLDKLDIKYELKESNEIFIEKYKNIPYSIVMLYDNHSHVSYNSIIECYSYIRIRKQDEQKDEHNLKNKTHVVRIPPLCEVEKRNMCDILNGIFDGLLQKDAPEIYYLNDEPYIKRQNHKVLERLMKCPHSKPLRIDLLRF
jgi:hypothetical protein